MKPASGPGRRSFLLGLGTLAAAPASGLTTPPRKMPDPLRAPDRIEVFDEDGKAIRLGVEVSVSVEQGRHGPESSIFLEAPKNPVTRIRLRWAGTFPAGARFLGDHWERSYGDLEFRGLVGERRMPWYFLVWDGHGLHGYGVKTGAASFCHWQADAAGVTLWLDVSNGGSGVQLGSRRLPAATIVTRTPRDGEASPGDWTASAQAFCRAMCARPMLPAQPVYGSNNWYYAYGNNTSAARSLRDAELMAELAPQSANRPFSVIDMGWHAAEEGAGPVTQTSAAYPDMPDLAKKTRAMGVRPGIWTRPTLTSEARCVPWGLPASGGRKRGKLITLDPSIPEALAYMAEGVRTLHEWGYELIKHDFSTFDLTGRWGFQMGPDITDRGWSFHDRSRTTAEIVTGLYTAIREASGASLLIGCNTVGHLAAGLVEVQRIGDDTSGREWNRTRKMGINTLAFRMPQHNTFFSADADCVAVTNEIPWALTKQWLELAARSGTALFVSADPETLEAALKPSIRDALAAASMTRQNAVALDSLDSTTPEAWRLDGKTERFDWYRDE